jgi:hypothetical protein
MEPNAYSVRCAPASGSSSCLALGSVQHTVAQHWASPHESAEFPTRVKPSELLLATTKRNSCENFHIPSDLVVDQWSSESESSLILDFLFLNSVWTTFDRLISDKLSQQYQRLVILPLNPGESAKLTVVNLAKAAAWPVAHYPNERWR